ncbi:hypothetical protein NQ314_009232 [Rhamnusium bicolor]|uniref:Uncharacterized protein n=1 Tax=Rhamnusium bicolor TaxID=1586634 RepID=A0AAV8Y3M2_9CUCU|nr:hypothetical protein NQ314_009232 [Rhamnusium bicolor]
MAPSEIVCAGVSLVASLLLCELEKICKEKRKKKRSLWIRAWISRRNRLGASSTLLKELSLEDKEAYKNHLRMTPEKFDELLSIVGPKIQKQSTWFRQPKSARTKLEITLRYLASGDSLTSLQYLYRVPNIQYQFFYPRC